MLNEDLLGLILTYLLPEDKMMMRVCSWYFNKTIPLNVVRSNDQITLGSVVCFKDRYVRKDFVTWGSDVGVVLRIQGNVVTIRANDRTVNRARSGVRRVRIFPDVITLTASDGIVRQCPGCYCKHRVALKDGYRSGKCRVSAHKFDINPFPMGYYLKHV